eukprot:scaffold112445_cov20-Tisochrysis_lutea.AAC.1
MSLLTKVGAQKTSCPAASLLLCKSQALLYPAFQQSLTTNVFARRFLQFEIRSSSAQAARQASSSGDTGPRSDQHQVDALMRSDSPVTCPQVALLQKRALMQASSCGGQGEASNAPVTCPLVPPLQNCALWCKQALAGIKAKPAAAC